MPPETVTYTADGSPSAHDHDLTVAYQVRRDGSFDVQVGDWSGRARVLGRDAGRLVLDVDQQRHTLDVLAAGDSVWVQGPDGDVCLHPRPRFPDASIETAAGALVAPMPGRVLAVEVHAGETVGLGQLLLILEAMKMEHRIVAAHAGTVAEVRAKAGDQVAGGDTLVVLEPLGP